MGDNSCLVIELQAKPNGKFDFSQQSVFTIVQACNHKAYNELLRYADCGKASLLRLPLFKYDKTTRRMWCASGKSYQAVGDNDSHDPDQASCRCTRCTCASARIRYQRGQDKRALMQRMKKRMRDDVKQRVETLRAAKTANDSTGDDL